MICWKCLRKMDPWLDDNNRQILRCRCGNKPGPGNDQARADRFMALAQAEAIARGIDVSSKRAANVVNSALSTMAEIERRVLDGTLWEGEKP